MKRIPTLLTLISMTALAVSCNSVKQESMNPLIEPWESEFGIPPFNRIRPEHYMPAFDSAMIAHLVEIETIVGNGEAPDFDNTILAMDNSGRMLDDVANIFLLISSADTNEAMQAIEEEISPLLAVHADKIALNEALFARVSRVYEGRSGMNLDAPQMRLTEKIYRSFERSGANLDAAGKERLKAINEELSTLEVKYGNNVLADSKAFVMELALDDLTGLPQSVIDAAADPDTPGVYRFDLGKPSWIPFLTHSDRRDLREKIYTAYLERANHNDANDNKQIINDIIRLRTEKANILGFETYAHYVLDDVMAGNPSNVYSLLDELWAPALERAKAELADMKEVRIEEGGDGSFYSWDWWYYAEKVRRSKYDLDEEMLRPYFALENVRSGIFELSNRLYGITFRPVGAPAYNSECMSYQVLDVDDTHLGILILDMHPRAGKRNGAWCGDFVSQRYENGRRVAPVVTISCNFTRPVGDLPALLNPDEVETFFHEFGHALHSLFCDVPYQGLRDVERDFVELPSQIMENWAFEPELLKRYAIHYEYGSPIPEYLIEKIRNSMLFNQGFMTVEYLAAALSDMDIHTLSPYEPLDVNRFERDALNVRRGLISEIEPRYRYPYFSHIFDTGYEAGYYSYIWAEVLDKDAYQAFVESGNIFDRDLAASFRSNLLSRGGMEDGMVLYGNFRGAGPGREPLLRARGLIGAEKEGKQGEINPD